MSTQPPIGKTGIEGPTGPTGSTEPLSIELTPEIREAMLDGFARGLAMKSVLKEIFPDLYK